MLTSLPPVDGHVTCRFPSGGRPASRRGLRLPENVEPAARPSCCHGGVRHFLLALLHLIPEAGTLAHRGEPVIAGARPDRQLLGRRQSKTAGAVFGAAGPMSETSLQRISFVALETAFAPLVAGYHRA